MHIIVNPQNYQPQLPITIGHDGKTETYKDLADLEGGLEHFIEPKSEYKATDAAGTVLEVVLFATELIMLRKRVDSGLKYYEYVTGNPKAAKLITEELDGNILRAAVFKADGNQTRSLPKQWDKQTEIEIGEDVGRTETTEAVFNQSWANRLY